jgi:leucyl-tRNA synthetase
VVTILEGGTPGACSKPLSKSPDGKKDLRLLAPSGKEKDGSDKAGGGKPAKGKPAKVAAKTGGLMHQWDILRSMGLSPDEIVSFVDPVHWLEYFPPLGKEDLIRFGVGVDWRRREASPS